MVGARFRIGRLGFHYAEYDQLGDVLYLYNDASGFPFARTRESAEGEVAVCLSKGPHGEEVAGLALIEPRRRAASDGRLMIPIPTAPPGIVELGSAELESIIERADSVPPPRGYEP